jgi:hypothetical protein
MTEANDARRTSERGTMSIGDAAAMLGMPVAQVRRLCKAFEANPDEGLAFAWSRAWAPTTDVNGHELRGHRQPYRDAVEALVRAKQRAERES